MYIYIYIYSVYIQWSDHILNLTSAILSVPGSPGPPRAPTQQRRKGRGVATGQPLHEAGVTLQDPRRLQGRDLEAEHQWSRPYKNHRNMMVSWDFTGFTLWLCQNSS